MFKQRLLTTLVLVPLVLLAIYYGNKWLLGSVVLLLIIIAGWEWLQLIPVSRVANKLIFILALLVATWASVYWLNYWLAAGLVIWGGILVAVLTYPGSQKYWGNPVIVGAAGLLLLPLLGSCLAALHQRSHGSDLIVYLLCLVWAADIGAYLAGKCWGRHKLIPRVSPGKTVEGMMGGFLLTMLVAFVAYWYFRPVYSFLWFVIAAGIMLISLLGDLFISMLKRRRNLKDTGQIFPGHGGVLDRLDSLIAALPLFYLGLHFMLPGL